MKLACASSAFDRAIERGDLTQIEFIEMCARELLSDGVVLDARHFPRTDDDYLAQVRKMATDLGLDIAALRSDEFFTADDESMRFTVTQARALATPLIVAPLALETALPWSAQLERLGHATSLAKGANVTLAVRNAPGTFASNVRELRRTTKEADSAWLRYGLEPELLDTADLLQLRANVVLLWAGPAVAAGTWEAFRDFGGYLALDDSYGASDAANVKTRLANWREFAISDRTRRLPHEV
jgi:hypothetical protein